jgi:hypothetical protein
MQEYTNWTYMKFELIDNPGIPATTSIEDVSKLVDPRVDDCSPKGISLRVLVPINVIKNRREQNSQDKYWQATYNKMNMVVAS